MSMSDLIAVMRDGRIEQLDRPEIVYARPVSRYVGSFVGAANLIEATVAEAAGDALRVVAGAFSAVLPASAVTTPGALAAGEAVTLLVRPEHLVPGAGGEDGIALSGRIVERTYLGNRVHLRFETGDGHVMLADARAEDVGEPGETFTAQLRPGRVAVLRKDSGAR